jgi:hypothetical protein
MNEIDYSLNSLIKQYGGLRKILKSPDFIFAFICALLFFIYIRFFAGADAGNFSKDLASDLLNISASLFGILFAAFAIILSLSDEKFMKFLRKYSVLDKILLPFWFVSILYIITIGFNLLIKFFPSDIAKYLMVFSILIFSWALFGTIYLVNDTISFARRRADYLEYEKEILEISKKEGKL